MAKLETHTPPALLLQLLANGTDALAVDVTVALANARSRAVLYAAAGPRLEPELHVINELQAEPAADLSV